ncbi:hypothetical protein FBEOM_1025 [Fusarium beomiforme]|uniref:Uncharacterized protein n=1 Tax=Fusarium beomiforme TaxID=44412 RepID=A0A9P5AU11_9HYPO|nr:hypothetical protein FBEOM_1025 [Fusarium beomiforme]
MFFKIIVTASALAGFVAAVPFNTSTACPTICIDAANDCGVMYGGCYPICSPELYPTAPPCTPSTSITPITPVVPVTPTTPDPTITLITPIPDPINTVN